MDLAGGVRCAIGPRCWTVMHLGDYYSQSREALRHFLVKVYKYNPSTSTFKSCFDGEGIYLVKDVIAYLGMSWQWANKRIMRCPPN